VGIGLLIWMGLSAPAVAGPFGGIPIDEALDQPKEALSEAEQRKQERLARLAELNAERAARVVVLKHSQGEADYRNDLLRRNVRARIVRPSAKFYPDVDLYQHGRKEPDPTVRPLDQRGSVPDGAIERVMARVHAIEATPWEGLSETSWGVEAHELRKLVEDEIWFVDRPELREALFRAYAEIGYAAENSNNPTPPYFEEVAGIGVNYYYYLAGAMASREPSLMGKLTNSERHASVKVFKDMIDRGEFQPMTINFEVDGVFDPNRFVSEYTVWFNGLEGEVTNLEGLFDVPPGRMDVYLKRDDGHSMSVRIEAVRLDDQELQNVRLQARKRMGLDLIDQLMLDPEQCIPDIDGDIVNYLAIYQKLHPAADLYIAVPRLGSAHDVLLWKWNADQGHLTRVNDNTGGFPVRFVALAGAGIVFSGLSAEFDPEALAESGRPKSLLEQSLTLRPSSLPLTFQLRGHWSRLMVGVQADLAFRADGQKWEELRYDGGGTDYTIQPGVGGGEATVYTASGSDPIPLGDADGIGAQHLRELRFQRGLFLNVAAVGGKDAAYGFGPRAGVRTGWYNAPRAVDLTGHVGWTVKPPLKKNARADTRVFPVIDTDLFAGIALPFRDTRLLMTNRIDPEDDTTALLTPGGDTLWAPMARGSADSGGQGACLDPGSCDVRKLGSPIPAIGFTLSAGLTF
jgi:hypothetical protein